MSQFLLRLEDKFAIHIRTDDVLAVRPLEDLARLVEKALG